MIPSRGKTENTNNHAYTWKKVKIDEKLEQKMYSLMHDYVISMPELYYYRMNAIKMQLFYQINLKKKYSEPLKDWQFQS